MTRRRLALAGLEAFVVANAYGGAAYGLAGAEGVPLEWLERTPFSDSTVPSAILGTAVGGSMTTAAIAVAQGSPHAGELSVAAGAVLVGWIGVQLAIWEGRSWMQTASLAAGLLTVALGRSLATTTRSRAA